MQPSNTKQSSSCTSITKMMTPLKHSKYISFTLLVLLCYAQESSSFTVPNHYHSNRVNSAAVGSRIARNSNNVVGANQIITCPQSDTVGYYYITLKTRSRCRSRTSTSRLTTSSNDNDEVVREKTPKKRGFFF